MKLSGDAKTLLVAALTRYEQSGAAFGSHVCPGSNADGTRSCEQCLSTLCGMLEAVEYLMPDERDVAVRLLRRLHQWEHGRTVPPGHEPPERTANHRH